jgi:hypothetical protein
MICSAIDRKIMLMTRATNTSIMVKPSWCEGLNGDRVSQHNAD